MAKKIEFHDGTDKFEEGTITDTIVLISSDWNDYGFKMLFDVLYFDSEGNYINLGGTRIYPSRFDDLRKLTNFVKNSKSKQYCTVGEDIRFYYKVYNTLGDEEALNFLEEINDVTVFGIGKLKEIDTSIFNNYNKEDIPSIISSEYMKISKLEDFKKRTLFRLNSELYDLLYLRDKVLQENETKNIINFINNLNHFELLSKKASSSISSYYSLFLSLVDIPELEECFWKRIVHLMEYNGKKDQKELLKKIKKRFKNNPDFLNYIDSKENNDLGKIINEIMGILKVTDPSKLKLCQYTEINTIKHVIVPKSSTKLTNTGNDSFKEKCQEKGCLRLTNSKQLNDPTEGKKLLNLLNLSASRENKEYTDSSIFISSASKKIDDLSLWREYTDNGVGACLVYDSKFLKSLYKNGREKLFKVCYIDTDIIELKTKGKKRKIRFKGDMNGIDEGKLSKEILKLYDCVNNSKLNVDDIINQLETVRYLFKDASYAYEDEYRLIVNECMPKKIVAENSNKCDVPFIYTYIDSDCPKYTKVYLGPKVMEWDYIAPYIKYCYSSKNKEISVCKSSQNYR